MRPAGRREQGVQYKYLDIERAAAHLHGMIDGFSATEETEAYGGDRVT